MADGTVAENVCNDQPCNPQPTDCVGEWSAYGECSMACGGGQQTRSYSVTTAALFGGVPLAAGESVIKCPSLLNVIKDTSYHSCY